MGGNGNAVARSGESAGKSLGLMWKSTSIESVVLVLMSDAGLMSADCGSLSLCNAAGLGLACPSRPNASDRYWSYAIFLDSCSILLRAGLDSLVGLFSFPKYPISVSPPIHLLSISCREAASIKSICFGPFLAAAAPPEPATLEDGYLEEALLSLEFFFRCRLFILSDKLLE